MLTTDSRGTTSLPTTTEVTNGSTALLRFLLIRPPGGENARHFTSAVRIRYDENDVHPSVERDHPEARMPDSSHLWYTACVMTTESCISRVERDHREARMPDTSHLQYTACVMITKTCLSWVERDHREVRMPDTSHLRYAACVMITTNNISRLENFHPEVRMPGTSHLQYTACVMLTTNFISPGGKRSACAKACRQVLMRHPFPPFVLRELDRAARQRCD